MVMLTVCFSKGRRMPPSITLLFLLLILSLLFPWEHLPASLRERLSVLANLVNALFALDLVPSLFRQISEGETKKDERESLSPTMDDDDDDD